MNSFSTDFSDYVLSGHTLLNVDTFEKDRAVSEIIEVAKDIERQVYVWSVAFGWKGVDGVDVCKVKPTAPVFEQLKAIFEFPNDTICVLRDFGGYTDHKTYPNYDVVIGFLDELRKIMSSVYQTIVFVGPDFCTPKALLHDVTQIKFDLPDKDHISKRIDFVCDGVEKEDKSKFEPDPEMLPQIIDACRGMTSQQTVDRVALALRKHKDLNEDAINTIVGEKASIIRTSGLLSYIEPPDGGLSNVGGYDAIKDHVLLDRPCFEQEARDFGIEFPKGLMLVGIPGCGKTLLSKVIASELGLPLISMDVGNLMNKYVGESEANLREAISMLESIAPCVLQLDEIEKGFGGAGDTDGGASRRVFGSFIKWMNDKTSPVYMIATANQVESLPPEFCRKGRFDEIYGLDLPSLVERQEIFHIHLSKRGRESKLFILKELATKTLGYTGADIEQVVKLGLKIAFSEGDLLESKHLFLAVEQIIPLSKTESERIQATREWCQNHAKPANPQKDNSSVKRKVTLQ